MGQKPKKTWQPPFIRPQSLGQLNKFGQRANRGDYTNEFAGVPISELIACYGSPVFVTSETRLRENVRRITGLFKSRWPDVVHGWSYKTNYTSAICNILHQEGSWAEVVSQFEYEKARSLGVPADKIIFNGPNKRRTILERAIAEGARLHVDHFDELELIEAVAREQRRCVDLTIRLNFETGFTEAWSRFGFNLESGQAHEAARRIALSSHLRLTGLHTHIGTFILEPRAFGKAIGTLCAFMREIEENSGEFIDVLDIGGGLPSRNALQGIYLPPEQAVPELEDFADAICDALRKGTAYRVEQGRALPRLIFESGRAVVDDAQILLTTVVGTKRLPDGRPSAILDAGVNLLFTGFWYDHQVKLTAPKTGQPTDTVLYGPMCMNIDVLRRSVSLPPLVVGDVLMFGPVGAYNNTQWLQFIEYRPNVVLIHSDGQHSVIRAAEDLAVMNSQDRLPQHLAGPNVAHRGSQKIWPSAAE